MDVYMKITVLRAYLAMMLTATKRLAFVLDLLTTRLWFCISFVEMCNMKIVTSHYHMSAGSL